MAFIYNSEINEFGFNSSGKVTVNGTADNTSSGVTSMLYWTHQVYYTNGTNWYHKSLAADSWTGPTTDPRNSVTESSQGDTVTDTTHFLYNSALDKWGINSSAQVTVNGTADTSTSSVQYLLYYSHRVYQYNGANFYYKALASDSWTGPTSDPRPAQPTESSQGTIVTDTTTFIYNSALDKWGINSSGQVTVNGTADTTTSSVVELAYYSHKVYQKNSAGNWYSKSIASDTWTATTDPTSSGSTSGPQAMSSDALVESIGVNFGVSSLSTTDITSLAQTMSDLGVRHIRCGSNFVASLNSQTKGTAMPNGVRVLMGWYVDSSNNNPSLSTFQNTTMPKLKTALQNQPGCLLAFEGINEPEGGLNSNNTATDFQNAISSAVSWQSQAWNALRADAAFNNVLFSTFPVASAFPDGANGFNKGVNLITTAVSDGIKNSGGSGYYDAISNHDAYTDRMPEQGASTTESYIGYINRVVSKPYQNAVGGSNITGLDSRQTLRGGKLPMFATEGGAPTFNAGIGYYHAQGGVLEPRQMLLRYASGTDRHYHYELYNLTQISGTTGPFALIVGQFTNNAMTGTSRPPYSTSTARPAYFALKNLIQLMTDPPSSAGADTFAPGKLNYSLAGPSGMTVTSQYQYPAYIRSPSYAIHHLLFQKRNGNFVICLWAYQSDSSTSGTYSSMYNTDGTVGPLTSAKQCTITINDGSMTKYKTATVTYNSATTNSFSTATTISNNSLTVNAFDYVTVIELSAT